MTDEKKEELTPLNPLVLDVLVAIESAAFTQADQDDMAREIAQQLRDHADLRTAAREASP